MILDPYGDVLAEALKAGDDMVLADLKAETRAMCTGVRWIQPSTRVVQGRVHANRARTRISGPYVFPPPTPGKQPRLGFSILWQSPNLTPLIRMNCRP